MFNIAVISDEISQDPAVAAALVAEFHGQGLEIRSVWEKSPHELDRQDIGRLRRIATEYGLRICSIASAVFKRRLDRPDEVAQRLDMLRRCIDLAHALDTRLIRVFSCWK
jgi:sugar phosphate isomerase/epimerase